MSTSQLVEQSKSTEAFFKKYYFLVEAATRRYRRRFQAADSDEINSDAAYGLYQAICQYDPVRGMTFEAFAACKIRQSINEGFRNRWQQKSVLKNAINIDVVNQDTESAFCVIHEDFQNVDDQDLVRAMLERLDEPSKQLIQLHFFEGLDVNEIANRTGLHWRGVYRKIETILNTLKREFRKDGR
jgi:RNA polymerase sigma factor (sigma-70 family)